MTIRFRLGLALAVALLPVLALGGLQAWMTGFRSRRRDPPQLESGTQAAQRSALTVARFRIQVAASADAAPDPHPRRRSASDCTPQAGRASWSRGSRATTNLVRTGRRPAACAALGARACRGDPTERREASHGSVAAAERLAERLRARRRPCRPRHQQPSSAAERADAARRRLSDGALVARLAAGRASGPTPATRPCPPRTTITRRWPTPTGA